MSSRTNVFLASTVAALALSACSSTYSDVYSFRKNSFKAPPPKKTEIVEPTPTADPLQAAPLGAPGGEAGIPGIPGAAPGAAPAIPGLETPPATPAPADPGAPAPTPAPGAIPGL
jgi:hypothetical protein